MKLKTVVKVLTILTLLVVLGLAIIPKSVANAEEFYSGSNVIIVKGEGCVCFAPDTATVNIGIDCSDAELAVAKQCTDDKLQAVISAIKELGVADECIQTSQYQTYKFKEIKNEESLSCYQVFTNLCVTVTDLEQLDTLINKSTQAGANIIGGINFSISNEKELYLQALETAVANATEKAEIIAAKSGKTISVKCVKELKNQQPFILKAETFGNFQSGTNCVCAYVQIVFEMI